MATVTLDFQELRDFVENVAYVSHISADDYRVEVAKLWNEKFGSRG